MRAVFTALRILPRTEHTNVFHHRIVPGDKLLSELTCFTRCDLVTKTPIDIHVKPIP